jgi:phage recombination protein Bet
MGTATQPNKTAPQQHQATPTQQQRDASLLNEMLDKSVEYVPFMGKDPIKLSARLVLNYLCTPTKSGKVCDERQAVRFVMLCKARGLNPWEGDAFLIGYDSQSGPQFSLITAHQAFLKRAEVHPEYDGMESGVIVRRQRVHADTGEVGFVTEELPGDFFEDGDQLCGAWARVHFKGRSHAMYKRVRLETFNKSFGRWKDDPAGMIVKVAEADALRSSFPNSLGGMYLEGEMPAADRESVKPDVPKPGRHSLRNGARAEPAAPPEPTADEARAEMAADDVVTDLLDRLAACESHKELQDVGAEALRKRETMGNERYAAFSKQYQERFNALSTTARQPGDE